LHKKSDREQQSPPHEEGWLRHQEEIGEAILSAADDEMDSSW
jgi:hypothetical protein